MPDSICCLLSHPDDEFFIFSYLRRLRTQGHCVSCVYTTDAAPHKFNVNRRFAETTRVLGNAGIAKQDIYQTGVTLNIPDAGAYYNLEKLYKNLNDFFSAMNFTQMIVPAWEGGHMDHDATHLLGRALAKTHNINLLTEFSLYNAYGMPKGLFRAMRLIPNGRPVNRRHLSVSESLYHFSQISHYRSQWKTFVGLGPDTLLKLIFFRQEDTRTELPRVEDYLKRPHAKTLLYENRFNILFEDFNNVTQPFIVQYIT